MAMIKPHVISALALVMVVWVAYLTYQVYTFPTIGNMIGEKKLVVIANNGQFYYVLSEKSLEEPITITDSKGNLYYVLSRKRLNALGPRAMVETDKLIVKNP